MIPVRCSTNWAMKPHTVFGVRSINWVHIFPWGVKWCEEYMKYMNQLIDLAPNVWLHSSVVFSPRLLVFTALPLSQCAHTLNSCSLISIQNAERYDLLMKLQSMQTIKTSSFCNCFGRFAFCSPEKMYAKKLSFPLETFCSTKNKRNFLFC